MFKLFDKFIKDVGPKYVVQIVTDSAANNVKAGNFTTNFTLLLSFMSTR